MKVFGTHEPGICNTLTSAQYSCIKVLDSSYLLLVIREVESHLSVEESKEEETLHG